MSWWMGIFTFVNVWCLMLFIVVPFKVRPASHAAPQEYAAAPQPVHWRKILLINTLASLVVTVLMALLFNSGLFHIDTMK